MSFFPSFFNFFLPKTLSRLSTSLEKDSNLSFLTTTRSKSCLNASIVSGLMSPSPSPSPPEAASALAATSNARSLPFARPFTQPSRAHASRFDAAAASTSGA